MTDKEIIIDGVNVAECKYHSSTPSSELCYMKGNKCNDNPNCYYKQLKRKTQECEELKKKFKNLFGIDNEECWTVAFLNDENARYKQALKQIEKECEHYKNAPVNFEAIYTKASMDEIIDIINGGLNGK